MDADLALTLQDGSSVKLHPRWLRERANDPKNLDVMTQQRFYNPSELQNPGDIKNIIREDGWLTFASRMAPAQGSGNPICSPNCPTRPIPGCRGKYPGNPPRRQRHR